MRAFIIKSLLYFFSWWPLSWNHRFGTLIGWLYWIIPNKIKHTIRQNIKHCFPQLSSEQQQRLIDQSLIEMGKNVTEMGVFWLWPTEKTLALITKISGKDILDQAIQQNKGVILAAPHFGAWELLGLYCGQHYPLTALYRPPRITALDQLIRSARQRSGAKLVPTDAQGMKQLIRDLKQNGLIGILPDQEPKKGKGIFAPFFNQPAYTMILLSKLAQKNQSPVVFALTERLPKAQGYHLHFIAADPKIYDHEMEISATALNQGVEQCVMRCPAQYQWSYKRFRHQPDPNKKIY